MSPINGIEIAEELRKISKDILIVFVTTSSDFMMQAFSVHAFHYIIKPYMPEQIYKVLDEAAFYIKDKAKFIRIVCDRKSVVSGMTYRTRMTMNEFLKLTDNGERFIPVNRGVVLNADYIERIDGALCIMGNGTRFSIKVREKSIIEKRVRDHMFKKLRENQRI